MEDFLYFCVCKKNSKVFEYGLPAGKFIFCNGDTHFLMNIMFLHLFTQHLMRVKQTSAVLGSGNLNKTLIIALLILSNFKSI